ncbi:MAG: ATPase [Dehalobacter sp. 4CP]|uniref:ATPase n=1 Tax=Dehalobacter sp. CP TaxID=2594474 RepID=UPI0013CA3BC0|nr:ATPase [Dehalobacter sp. 4CP]
MKGNMKHVFPGGNTSEGFFSYYSFLLEKGTKRVFVLKGGPGVGKSTLMKKIGNRMVEMGYDVEFHHCSSDHHSLDGIAVVDAGIVMVDGTAPHIVDPKYPGGLDEIINLGEYWDTDAIQHNVKHIIASTNEVSRLFARAYRLLSAARAVAENMMAITRQSMDFSALNMETLRLAKKIFEGVYMAENSGRTGVARHLFSCAYTPEGFVDFTDSILQEIEEIVYLEGEMGTGRSVFMEKIAAKAMENGFDVEIYHLPLIPSKIGTIVIKELQVALTSSEYFRNNHQESVNLNRHVHTELSSSLTQELNSDLDLFGQLMLSGMDCIHQAKQEHDALEQYYVPYMNFKAVEEKYEEILSRILDIVDSEACAAEKQLH